MVLLVELYCEVKLQIVFLCSCLCVEKLIKNTIIETYCLRHCRQGTPTRAVHAEGGAVPINTKVKSEDTEITDSGEITDIKNDGHLHYARPQTPGVHSV